MIKNARVITILLFYSSNILIIVNIFKTELDIVILSDFFDQQGLCQVYCSSFVKHQLFSCLGVWGSDDPK